MTEFTLLQNIGLVVDPPEEDIVDSEEDCDSLSTISSTGADGGGNKRKKDDVDRNLAVALEHLDCFEIPFGEKNRMTTHKDEHSERFSHWNIAWNNTIHKIGQCDANLVKLLEKSVKEPDNAQGGCRWHKQILEYLVIGAWIPAIYDASVSDLKQKCLQLLTAERPEMVAAVKRLAGHLHERHVTVDRIVRNVRHVFLTEKIFTHTIKGKNQTLPALKEFCDAPTVDTYRDLVLYLADKFCRPRHEAMVSFYQSLGSSSITTPTADHFERAKRVRRSESESNAIKKKHGCMCRGPPRGENGARLLFACEQRPVHIKMLELDHCLPFATFQDDSTSMLCPLDPTCHGFKTRYVDPILIRHRENSVMLEKFWKENTLPDELIHQINLQYRRDSEEA